MTRLSGDLQTDLALPDALAACAGAVHGLGWHIESLEGKHIVSYATDSTQPSPKIEIALDDSGPKTEVRIIGSDTDADPLTERELIAELNRARDAVEMCVEQAVEASEIASEEQDAPENEPAVGSSEDGDGELPSEPDTEQRTAPADWYEVPDGAGERPWESIHWTKQVRSNQPAPGTRKTAMGTKGEGPAPPSISSGDSL